MDAEIIAAFISGGVALVAVFFTIANDRSMRRRQQTFEEQQQQAMRDHQKIVAELTSKTDFLAQVLVPRTNAQREFLDSLDRYSRSCREQNRLNSLSNVPREERDKADVRYRAAVQELEAAISGVAAYFSKSVEQAARVAMGAAQNLRPGIGDGAYMKAKADFIAVAKTELSSVPTPPLDVG